MTIAIAELSRQLIEELPDGVLLIDEKGDVLAANPALGQLAGSAPDDLIGRPLAALLTLAEDERGDDDILRAIQESPSLALKLRHSSGRMLSVEVRRSLVTHAGESLLLITLRDVTEQVQKYERLIRNEHEKRLIAEGLRGILDVLNSERPAGEILEYIMVEAQRLLKAGAVAIFRLRDEGSQPTLELEAARELPPDYVSGMQVPLGVGAIGRAVSEHRPVYMPDMRAALPDYQRLGDPRREALLMQLMEHYRAVLAVPLWMRDEMYGSLVLYYAEPRDLTPEDIELAAAFGDQVALAIANARLRMQAEQAATMAERQRLARELHDAVTQTLFSANLIAEVLPQLWQEDPDEFLQRVADLRRLTRGALAEMRTLLLELRPAALVETPLRDLVRQLVEAITGRTRLNVEFTANGGQHVYPAEIQLALYRIAQEALRNVVKHARAHTLRVELVTTPAQVALTIEDDGQGFDPQNVPADHFGLRIMRERAAAIGAALTLNTRIGEGTSVAVQWLSPAQEET